MALINKNKHTTIQTKPAGKQRAYSDDMELLVIEDVDNANEYYMVLIDSFSIEGRHYVALNSYDIDSLSNRRPEFVIMRHAKTANGEEFYQSIRSRKELDLAFNTFFKRYVEQL